MARGARRTQRILDGDPTHTISLEGSLADRRQRVKSWRIVWPGAVDILYLYQYSRCVSKDEPLPIVFYRKDHE
jgi:hypothetical protein